jgi:hypothetical protein
LAAIDATLQKQPFWTGRFWPQSGRSEIKRCKSV